MRLLLNKITKASYIKLAYQPISQYSVKKKPNPAFIKNELKLKKTKNNNGHVMRSWDCLNYMLGHTVCERTQLCVCFGSINIYNLYTFLFMKSRKPTSFYSFLFLKSKQTLILPNCRQAKIFYNLLYKRIIYKFLSVLHKCNHGLNECLKFHLVKSRNVKI